MRNFEIVILVHLVSSLHRTVNTISVIPEASTCGKEQEKFFTFSGRESDMKDINAKVRSSNKYILEIGHGFPDLFVL